MMSANRHPQGVGQFSDGNLGQLSNGIYTRAFQCYSLWPEHGRRPQSVVSPKMWVITKEYSLTFVPPYGMIDVTEKSLCCRNCHTGGRFRCGLAGISVKVEDFGWTFSQMHTEPRITAQSVCVFRTCRLKVVLSSSRVRSAAA